jgi:hypothetical protein
MSLFTRHDADGDEDYEPVQDRWDGGHEMARVASLSDANPFTRTQNNAVTWPTAVFSGQNQPVDHGILTLNALLAPDFPRPTLPPWTQWPDRLHLWPAVATIPWSAFGFWAHSEPMHALFAAGFLTVGLGLLAVGALGVAAGNAIAREADAEPQDKAGTRILLAAGLASVSGGAATGGGFSGIGCMLAAGTLAAGYGSYFGWKRHNRNLAVQAVIAYAAASNPGPLPSGAPLPVAAPQGPSNPFEARIQGALEAMKIEGTRIGSPQRIASDVWRFHCELARGAGSPQALAKKEEILASYMEGPRRVEIEPMGGNRFVLDVYSGPDRTDEIYPWDGTMITTADGVVNISYDDAARPLGIDLSEHILVTGKTRMGKSALERLLLCATLNAPIVNFGFDAKDGAPGLGMFEPVMHYLATDPLDGVRMLFGTKAIGAARGRLMRDKGVEEWNADLGPRIVAYIDEGAELTRRAAEAAVIVQSNLQLSLASWITIVYGTQTPSGPVWGKNTDARHQFGKRIGFHNEATANNEVFGPGAAGAGWRLQDLDGKGKFFLQSLECPRPRKRKALWVPREEAVELIERYASRRQELDAMSAEAFEAGMAAFDEALAAGEDPFASLDPTPGGGGPGRGKQDAIDVAQDFATGRAFLSLVPKYPDNEPIEAKHQALWDLLGKYGADGALATELVTYELKDFTSESNVRKQMKTWVARGYVVAEKDGRADRFARADKQPGADRKEA